MKKKRISKVPWYSEEAGFFGPGYLKEYADTLPQERTFKEVDFLEKILTLQKGMKILDCPCGHGRHSVELARRGYNVTGQDLNGFFLEEAKRAAVSAGVSVHWNKGDMRKIPLENEFDIALNLFTSLGYLESDDEDQKVLDAIAKTMKQGGKFVLDVINRDRVVQNYISNYWMKHSDGSILLTEAKFDHVTGRNNERRTRIDVDGNREDFLLPLRMYTVVELVKMLCKAGLILKETYGNYNGESLTFDSNRFILVAEKD